MYVRDNSYDFLLPCKLRNGYTNKYLYACISKIEIVNGKNTDLNVDTPVYAIHLHHVAETYVGMLRKAD